MDRCASYASRARDVGGSGDYGSAYQEVEGGCAVRLCVLSTRGYRKVLGVSVGESDVSSVSIGHLHGEYTGHGGAGWAVGWEICTLKSEYL